MNSGEIDSERMIRGWRLTACREAVGIDSVAKLAAFIRDYAEAKGHPSPRGFSARTLNDIERGASTLSPQAADYIANALGVSTTFFTAPIGRLGDVLAGEQAAAGRAPATPYSELLSQRAEAQHALADEALAALDAARRAAPDQSTPEGQRSQRKRTA